MRPTRRRRAGDFDARRWTRALLARELQRADCESQAGPGPSRSCIQRRYNPEGISQYNIVPGLLGVILQMTMVMMTSMALTRETERGTMENLLAMPASPFEIMLGKVAPYLAGRRRAGGGGAGRGKLSVRRAVRRQRVAAARRRCLLFVLALVWLGYTISTIARSRCRRCS